MKRMIAFLICFSLLFHLSGCGSAVDNTPRPTESVASTLEQTSSAEPETTQTEASEAETSHRENPDTSAPETTVSEEPLSSPESMPETTSTPTPSTPTPSTPTTPVQPPSDQPDYSNHEVIELEGVEEPAELPQISEEVQIVSVHSALSKELYYQYSFLSDTEKTAYLKLVQAIQNGETIVDLSACGCSVDSASTVFTAVISDYPQFFYVAKSFGYTSSARKNTIKQFILIYFDGETQDQYNAQGTLATSADRSRIDQQIQAFNSKVSEIIGNIPANVSDLEKEKRIYDYLQDTITYDNAAAATVTNDSDTSCHAFDAYGAACEGLAVCEGYAELFQYLCYCVNINATPVYGTAAGGSHMWNAVCLDAEWYMVDATWDDAAKEGLHCYGYFNVTDSEIRADHTIDDATTHVPACSATTYAYYNWYALYVSSFSENPANYESVVDYLAKNKEDYLCVYIGNLSGNEQDYIQQYILSPRSDLQRYISSKGYSLSFRSSYYTIGNYGYIPLR